MSLVNLVDNSQTDKNTAHSYLDLYQKLLEDKKKTAKNILEIGIGGGGSIQLWNDFFVNANIYSLDITPMNWVFEKLLHLDRVTLYTGVDAYDEKICNSYFLKKNIKFDMILDDGAHTLDTMIKFIELYSKLLTDDGILIIEDIPDITWIETLKKVTPDNLKKYVEFYDIRHIKNTFDDIVFVINKTTHNKENNNRIIQQLLDNLYSNNSPYLSCNKEYLDNGYPHTYILYDLLQVLFTNIEPTYIVECGSMLGGSAIRMAETLRNNNKTTEIICIDPFTGDTNMWDWEKNGGTGNGGWRFLRLENGIPTIYKRFLANCKYSGFENKILPINTTTSVGIKLLQRLFTQNRITELPNYIYLDSAHEKDETFIELFVCWNCLINNSILFGDDWDWDVVRGDVIKFSSTITDKTDYENLHKIHTLINGSRIINNNILLYKGQWVLFKK